MRIGVNATCLNNRPSGARQRFSGIYGALFKRLPDAEFLIFEPLDCQVSEWFSGQTNVVARSTPIPSEGSRLRKFAAGFGFWGQALSNESFDLFEALHLPMVRPVNGKAVLTIHDVRGLRDESGLTHRTLFASALRSALSRADHVVTVSAAMRNEILEFYPEIPVSVVYNGLDVGPFADVTQEDCNAFTTKYGLPSDFILAVGHFESRKNYPRLIEALALLKQRGLDCPLVIIGNDSGEIAVLSRQILELGLDRQVALLSGLSDAEVRCAYILSSLFVFPSSYEGFGIPILEAMAAQKPMALSHLAVFEEITEGQSIYFPPDDVEAMANAIELGLTSNEKREQMIRYGLDRLPEFGFDQLADKMVQVYEQLC